MTSLQCVSPNGTDELSMSWPTAHAGIACDVAHSPIKTSSLMTESCGIAGFGHVESTTVPAGIRHIESMTVPAGVRHVASSSIPTAIDAEVKLHDSSLADSLTCRSCTFTFS